MFSKKTRGSFVQADKLVKMTDSYDKVEILRRLSPQVWKNDLGTKSFYHTAMVDGRGLIAKG